MSRTHVKTPADSQGAVKTDENVRSAGAPVRADLKRPLSHWAINYAAVGLLLLLIAFFSIVRPQTFPTIGDFQTIVSTQSVLAILALGTVLPLVTGEFDLSVGSMVSFSAILTAKLVSTHTSVPVALLLVVLVGASVGTFNTLLIVRFEITSFIATLGTGLLLAGLTTWVANGQTIYQNIGTNLTNLGNNMVLGVPIPGLYVIVISAVLWFVLERTSLGRQMYATGSGRQAARLAGIRTERRIWLAFVIAAVLAGLAGFLHAAELGSASPGVGDSFLLPAFAAAFVGSTTIRAGRFNVLGTLVGVLLLAVGVTGLTLMGAAFYVNDLFHGAALIIAVGLGAMGARRAKRAVA
jgi:ribose transport system permease protein